MADSDDDHDRRNTRDKFHHERNDYDRRQNDRMRYGKRGRNDSFSVGRPNYGYRSSPPQRRDTSPSYAKRIRRDDYGPPPQRYGPMHGGPPPHWGPPATPVPPPQGPKPPELDYPTQPPMMSYKSFSMNQETGLHEEEMIRRYNDYKTDFKKKQINEFFLQHKDEEWFRSKYHPEEFKKNEAKVRAALTNRCKIFMKLVEMNALDGVNVDCEKSNQLVKLLDKAVILMEGGTEFDFKCLEKDNSSENTPQKPSERTRVSERSEKSSTKKTLEDDEISSSTSEGEDDQEEEEEKSKATKGGVGSTVTDVLDLVNGDGENVVKQMKAAATGKEGGMDDEKEGIDEKIKTEEAEALPQVDGPPDAREFDRTRKRQRNNSGDSASSYSSYSSYSSSSSSSADSSSSSTSDSEDEPTATSKPRISAAPTKENEDLGPQPRPFHITQSIFLRNLAPTITQQEVEALCKKYQGYVRVAIQDPQTERRFARRGWVTFDRTANVKDICFSLNNIRLRDCDMGAIVNRELKQRIRAVNGLTVHEQVVRQDIKHAAKVVQNYDNRYKVWIDPSEESAEDGNKQRAFGLNMRNPLIKGITDYLVDEGSYEEEALLGETAEDKPKDTNPLVIIQRNEELLKVLDRLVLYLRVVYSFDFYSAVEYPNEDEMPHRCGIMHARGTNLSTSIHQSDVDDWMKLFEKKILPFVNMKPFLDESETMKLGKKSQDDEVEKFILANTQELAKDKWLCPLSGKKFKGPEYIRKHIYSKHADKIEEVKQEVLYFNNYLRDARRPLLPEHPTTRQLPPPPAPGESSKQPTSGANFLGAPPLPHPFYGPPGHPMMYRGGMAPYGPPPPPFPAISRAPPTDTSNRGARPSFRGRGQFGARRDRTTRPDPRRMISYKDLDAPAEEDIF